MKMVPNILTATRLVLAPIVTWCIVQSWWAWATGLFACAALTDCFDGFIARHFNAHTRLGACLDPVADKALMGGVFCACALIQPPLVPLWFALCVLAKEFLLLIGAGVTLRLGALKQAAPLALGKITMVAQVIGVAILLSSHVWGIWLPMRSAVIVVLTVLIGASLVAYAYNGLQLWRSSCATS